jgi:hypothetical protein
MFIAIISPWTRAPAERDVSEQRPISGSAGAVIKRLETWL